MSHLKGYNIFKKKLFLGIEDLSDEFNKKSTRSIGRNIPFAITFIGHIVYIRKLVFKKYIRINFFH